MKKLTKKFSAWLLCAGFAMTIALTFCTKPTADQGRSQDTTTDDTSGKGNFDRQQADTTSTSSDTTRQQ